MYLLTEMLLCHIAGTLLLFLTGTNANTLNDTRTLVNALLNDYNTNVLPVSDQDTTLNVTVPSYLKTIQEFDEVQEVFVYTCGFAVTWQYAGMVWDPAQYGGVDEVMISYEAVWVPDLILTTSSREMDTFGRSWQMVTYMPNGSASWVTGGLVMTTCSVDVTNYPFDRQACKSEYSVTTYSIKDVELFSPLDYVIIDSYTGNGAWLLDGTNVKIVNTEWISQLEVTISLRRKAGFFVINVLMPLVLLNVINVFVFLLSPESGERISYCITVLLSITVFMTIISDTLPKSSEPLPKISYKLMFDMVSSSLITLVTILNLRLYYKDDRKPIPDWLEKMYSVLCLSRRRVTPDITSSKVHPSPISPNDAIEPQDANAQEIELTAVVRSYLKRNIPELEVGQKALSESEIEAMTSSYLKRNIPELVDGQRASSESEMETITVTWKAISCMMDYISLAFFMCTSALSFGVFMLLVNQS